MGENYHDWGHLPYESAGLITKWLKEEISEAELQRLHALLDEPTRERILRAFKDTPAFAERMILLQGLNKPAAWKKVAEKQRRARRRALRRKLTYAAAAMLVALAATLWLGRDRHQDRVVADSAYGYANDVLPGTTQAELTLSSGKKVLLRNDSLELREEDGTRLRSNMGALQYAAGGDDGTAATAPLYNTLRVPEAGTFHLRLPDGTGVWLNAASELTFPVRFTGPERHVTLRGEGYFEVAHNNGQPFKVTANNTDIQVLGTVFNISGYAENATITTLVSGRVSVTAAGKNVVLRPGQQALAEAGSIQTAKADIEKATAWKNGYFYFSQDPITAIMEQLSRWYGVTVVYEGTVRRTEKYGGSISRDARLGEVLEQLKSISQLEFRINGTTLTVSEHAMK